LGQPRELKNSAIVLKFDTLVDWMNTWGLFFNFSKSSFLGLWDPFRPKSLGQYREQNLEFISAAPNDVSCGE